MTNKEEIRNVVKSSLRGASGRSASEAADIIASAIYDHLNKEETFSVAEEPLPPGIVPAPHPDREPTPLRPVPGGQINSEGLLELKAVPNPNAAKSKSSVARNCRSLEDITTIVDSIAPPYVEVIPEGRTETLPLDRAIMSDQQSGGVLLAYRPRRMEAGISNPQVWFWQTDPEPPDVLAAVEKMKEQAIKMYRLRTGPITTHVKDLGPVSTRYAAREQV